MKGFYDLLKERERSNFSGAAPADFDDGLEPDAAESPDAAHGFTIGLKKKRRSVMLKNMLVDAGYGDLAKMINVKEI